MVKFSRRGFLATATMGGLLLSSCARSAGTYETAEAEIGDVRDAVPAVGTIHPASQVEVRADVGGRVSTVSAVSNAQVRRGDVLATIEPDRLTIDLEAARAEQEAAAASVRETEARLQLAERHVSSRRSLAENGFISDAALSQAEGEARAARASLDRALAEEVRADARVRAASGVLGDVQIRAPIDGFVLSRNVDVGQVVGPTDQDPLFMIASDLRRVLVEALVAEPDIGRITTDARISFSVEAYPQRRFSGVLRDVLRDPRRDGNFVAYPVLIDAENVEGLLFPGMTAAVEFIHADAREVLRVPVEAIYFRPRDYVPKLSPEFERQLRRRGLTDPVALDGAEMGSLFRTGRNRVFVLVDGRPQMKAIRIGAESPDHVEIVEGLRVGDAIVLAETAADRS